MAQVSKTTIALVTGANKGIGRATAIKIADPNILKALARDHGYSVIVGSRQVAAGEAVASEIKAQGYQATSVQLDLSSDESITKAVKTIEEKYGRLDVLINNAAIYLDADIPKLPTRELFTRTLDINVTGTAVLTEALVPLLRKADGGPRLVFVSSGMASMATTTNKDLLWYNLDCASYDCSKVAMNMLALNYVRSLEDVRGRVFIASPGLVSTDMTKHASYGTTPEVGAAHIVALATAGEDAQNGTFSGKEGPIPW
ncbi:15-hydroxyprostaglandin dehydrogenase [Hyphodiscus hymeniophilus]|uniref:15-hydroxyprostaglandin dehydrogenase n=1 Tax=Hyphodiscus hymeniophilus TaxID=353542 RepID=A0A9P6VFR8_9HELO|nr:15-hydroxyprostaglandin dehydrogenase [Hyphodiscus hymeniophilus]